MALILKLKLFIASDLITLSPMRGKGTSAVAIDDRFTKPYSFCGDAADDGGGISGSFGRT